MLVCPCNCQKSVTLSTHIICSIYLPLAKNALHYFLPAFVQKSFDNRKNSVLQQGKVMDNKMRSTAIL